MIALLRDPVDRAHSNWTHLWSAGLEPEGDFLRACALEDPPGGPWLGAVLALPRPRPVRRAAATGCTRWSRASRCSCCATATCGSAPVETLDVIFGFLGVRDRCGRRGPGRERDHPRHRQPPQPGHLRALRAGARLGHGRLAPAWQPTSDWLSRHLQREQNLRRPAGAGAARGPAAAGRRRRRAAGAGHRGDVRRLARPRARRSSGRRCGSPDKIGTGYQSIDDPFGERTGQRARGLLRATSAGGWCTSRWPPLVLRPRCTSGRCTTC